METCRHLKTQEFKNDDGVIVFFFKVAFQVSIHRVFKKLRFELSCVFTECEWTERPKGKRTFAFSDKNGCLWSGKTVSIAIRVDREMHENGIFYWCFQIKTDTCGLDLKVGARLLVNVTSN